MGSLQAHEEKKEKNKQKPYATNKCLFEWEKISVWREPKWSKHGNGRGRGREEWVGYHPSNKKERYQNSGHMIEYLRFKTPK
jgi:hypothetical protein